MLEQRYNKTAIRHKRQYGINGNNNFNFIKHTAMLYLVKYVPNALT